MDPLGICDQASSYFDQNSPEASQRTSQHIGTLTGELETCDWDQLHKNYAQAMEEHGATESELRARISKLLEVVQVVLVVWFMTDLAQVFMTWSQTTVVRDETRALKRLELIGHVFY